MYSLSCFFCGQIHSSEFWEEADAAVEKCREKASARDRGELDTWEDSTCPIRCEVSIPPDERIIEQERAA